MKRLSFFLGAFLASALAAHAQPAAVPVMPCNGTIVPTSINELPRIRIPAQPFAPRMPYMQPSFAQRYAECNRKKTAAIEKCRKDAVNEITMDFFTPRTGPRNYTLDDRYKLLIEACTEEATAAFDACMNPPPLIRKL